MTRGVKTSLCATCAAICMVAAVTAHPGVEHDIERINGRLRVSPAEPELYVERAALHRMRGDYAAALEDLAAAAALNPGLVRIELERGLCLMAIGADEEALARLDSYLAQGGDAAAAYLARGRIHAARAAHDEAAADFSAAADRAPSVDAYLALGQALKSAGRLDEAAERLREGLDCLDGAVVLRLALIRAQAQRGRYDAALELIDEAMAAAPVKTEWHFRRVDVLVAAGRDAEAAIELGRARLESERALRRRPTQQHQELAARLEALREKLKALEDPSACKR